MTYKPELDGLRAFALFLVLCTHMELLGIKGGFVGVDIFFVLSGYLITTIIVTDIEKGRFGFGNFFGRRIMRLYPAFLFILFLTIAAYFVLTDPETFKVMARSARYVLFSLGNIFFDNNLGYFDAAAQKQGLLHTWSLGIEWQFYLAWPFIIWGAMKFSSNNRRVLFGVILFVVIASLISSEWAVNNDLKGAYYLIQNRAFELGLGGLLMFCYDREVSQKQGVALVVVGVITLLLLSFVFYHYQMKFPGLAGLVPCAAAAACMMGSKAFTKGNFFRWPFMVYIGKSSYSIYLVHWPLLVLSKYYLYRNLFVHERVALVFISIALGCLVFSTIETHINWRSVKNKRLGCAVMVGLTVALLIPMQHAGRSGKGWPWRVGEDNPLLNAAYHDWGAGKFPKDAILGDPNGKLAAIIMGDSFAANMSIGFNSYYAPLGQKAVRNYEPGCMMSVAELPGYDLGADCRAAAKRTIELVQASPGVPLIIIQAWGGPVIQADANGTPLDVEAQKYYNDMLKVNLDDIRQRIGADRPLFLIASPPYRHWGVGENECLLRPSFIKQPCEQHMPPYPVEQSPVNSANTTLKEYAQESEHTYYIDTSNSACLGGICMPTHNSMLYFDGYHTSVYGAELLVKDATQQISLILATQEKKAPENTAEDNLAVNTSTEPRAVPAQ